MTHIASSLRRFSVYFGAIVVIISAAFVPQAFAADPASQIHLSKNWSGYEMVGSSYTSVSGSWTVASSTPTNSKMSAEATWVGIGGANTSDLIQAGTQTIFVKGKPQYLAWYEILPDNQHALPITVAPGDMVSVSLTETSPGMWQLVFVNNTTGKIYQTHIPYVSSHSSAEWVIERPLAVTNAGTGYLPLNNFGTVAFKNASAQSNGVNIAVTADTAEQLVMSSTGIVAESLPTKAYGGVFSIMYLSPSLGRSYLRDLINTTTRVTTPAQHHEIPVQNLDLSSGTLIVNLSFASRH
ncbi:MAG: hypothetical protein JWL75_608 [Parcubacteria group bacterium]|nr:hypothetical protein [Parcubacteria group bacterium]